MRVLSTESMNAHYSNLANGEAQPMSADFRDKCKGAIVGTLVGDALFQPIEFSSKLGHPWIDKMTKGTVWGIPAGYYTDDSSMMLCIMQGFLNDTENYHVRNIAQAFVEWMDNGLWSATGNCFDIGTSCAAGLRAFKQKGSLVNGNRYTQGCGGIMRFASSWMVEYKTSGNKNANRRLGAMLDINNIDHYNAECVIAIQKLANIYNSHLMDNKHTTEVSAYKTWEDATGGGDAYGCLETALWAFNTTHNFRDAVIASGNVGGDTDSVAAVAGGIAGSYYGYSAIPREWIHALPEWDKLESFIEKFLAATIA